jgi:hypothetical protein
MRSAVSVCQQVAVVLVALLSGVYAPTDKEQMVRASVITWEGRLRTLLNRAKDDKVHTHSERQGASLAHVG